MPWHWPWSKVEQAPPTLRQVIERLSEVESRLDFLEKDHTKLRGRLTGGLRKPKEEEVPEATGEAIASRPSTPTLSLTKRSQRGF